MLVVSLYAWRATEEYDTEAEALARLAGDSQSAFDSRGEEP
jgi:hypothetical protein